jgi:hypothetical protein
LEVEVEEILEILARLASSTLFQDLEETNQLMFLDPLWKY